MTNIVPIDRSRSVVSKEEYVGAIQHWIASRNAAEALTREEIGAMGRVERMDAQRKTLIEGLAHYFRMHPRADVAPGVYAIITFLCDNENGVSTISQARMAKLFGRSRSSISDAQERLREDNLIATGRGCKAGSYPIIPRAMTHAYNHQTWLIDAICTQDASQNCPASPDNSELSGQTLQLGKLSGQTLQLQASNCRVVDPELSGQTDTTSKDTSTTPNNAGARESAGLSKAAAAVAIGITTAMASLPLAAAAQDAPVIIQPAQHQIDFDVLMQRLLDAGGLALANPAVCPGLLVLSEPDRWLRAGCNLDLDILPTIRAAAAKKRPGSIGSWSYFTDAVADAKATRLSPMPEGTARGPTRGNAHRGGEKASNSKPVDLLDGFVKPAWETEAW